MNAASDPQPPLIVFCRSPQPGRSKTRLAQSIGIDGASVLYRWMLEHTINVACAASSHVILAADSMDTADELRCFWDGAIITQQGATLGDRMYHALLTHCSIEDAQGAIIVGSDIPGLRTEHLRQAIAALQHHNVVLGPTTDGGYYLIGCQQATEELFQGIPWSTSVVFEHTLERCRSLEYRTALLGVLDDVDTVDDLRLSEQRVPVDEAGRAWREMLKPYFDQAL